MNTQAFRELDEALRKADELKTKHLRNILAIGKGIQTRCREAYLALFPESASPYNRSPESCWMFASSIDLSCDEGISIQFIEPGWRGSSDKTVKELLLEERLLDEEGRIAYARKVMVAWQAKARKATEAAKLKKTDRIAKLEAELASLCKAQ